MVKRVVQRPQQRGASEASRALPERGQNPAAPPRLDSGLSRLQLIEFVLDAAEDLVVVLDPERRIVFFNRHLEELSGYTLHEVAGKSWFETFLPEAQRPHLASVFERTKGTENRGTVNDIVLRDGGRVTVQWSNTPLHDDAGELIGILAVGHDLTDRQRRSSAESESQSLSRLLATVSHDLRQPLQASIFYLSALERELADSPPKTLPKLERCLKALSGLVDTLLNLSRLETGTVEPAIQVFPLNTLLEELVEEFEGVASDKGLELKAVPCDTGVQSDPQLLRQMLQNLLSNALRYTSEGRILLGCRCSKDTVRIQVWDSGPGIPEEQQQEIFREFVRLPQADPGEPGLGLGLAIVVRLGTLLDHPVRLASRPGRGSMFEVAIPLVDRRRLRAKKESPQARPGQCLCVVLDNDPDVLDSLRLALEVMGHEVIAGDDVESLLPRLEELDRVPDLLIADYHLPGINGLEALDLLRSALDASVPGLLLTGDTSGQALRQKASRLGLEVLHKPVVATELERVLNRRARH